VGKKGEWGKRFHPICTKKQHILVDGDSPSPHFSPAHAPSKYIQKKRDIFFFTHVGKMGKAPMDVRKKGYFSH
jgi:hypothetical protein